MTKNSKNWERKCIFATVIRLSLVNITDMSLIHTQDNVKTSYNNYIIQQLKFSYISVKKPYRARCLVGLHFFKLRLSSVIKAYCHYHVSNYPVSYYEHNIFTKRDYEPIKNFPNSPLLTLFHAVSCKLFGNVAFDS